MFHLLSYCTVKTQLLRCCSSFRLLSSFNYKLIKKQKMTMNEVIWQCINSTAIAQYIRYLIRAGMWIICTLIVDCRSRFKLQLGIEI